MAGASETNVDRRERLRKLALETIDLAKVTHSGDTGSHSHRFAGPLHSTQPPGLFGMSSLLDAPYKRRLLPGPHPG